MPILKNTFIVPFDPHDFQSKVMGEARGFDRYGLWMDVGTGKTLTSTYLGLERTVDSSIHQLLFLVPPSLVYQWGSWLKSITFMDGEPLDVVLYQGTIKQREKLNLIADCVVMSHNIFRGDFARISRELGSDVNTMVIYDESHQGLRKLSNKIYKRVTNFCVGKPLLLLSATPIGNPGDAYPVIKLLDKTIYKRKKDFERQHVADRDYFENVTAWKNLEDLHINLYKRASKIEARDVLDMPDRVFSSLLYELAPKHRKMYDELVTQQFLETDDGEIVDATKGTSMFHTLQRFVTSPAKMNLKKLEANLFDIANTVYQEDASKLVIFANYRDTNETLLETFLKRGIKAVGCWGKHSMKQQQASKQAFMHDPETTVIIGNPKSLGVGTDGMQYCCYRVLFMELPLVPRRFYQALGRIDRQGQKNKVVIRCAIADDTIQVPLYYSLLRKDELVNQIVKNRKKMHELFEISLR